MLKLRARLFLCLSLLASHSLALEHAPAGIPAAQPGATASMQRLDDETLADVSAQAGSLIVSDRIGPNELVGAGANNTFANFTFYRMGLDAKLGMNLNMSKMQAGCGGVNDFLVTSPACDFDIDYLSFMGINGAGLAPGAAGSEFTMTRPFIELAIKNDSNPAQREVVGVRVAGASINGALAIGREYLTNGATNMENGGTCDTNATTGTGVLNCHSGVNSISGFLSMEMSAVIRARAQILGYDTDLNTCFGRLSFNQYGCGPGTTPFFIETGGTRLAQLHAAAAKLTVDSINMNCAWWDAFCAIAQGVANGIVDEGYGQLVLNARHLHYLVTPNSPDFFISFQRERVSWPNYTKNVPPNNVAYDICNPAYGQTTARCSSAYSAPANTGWWLNATGVKLRDINPPDRINVGPVDVGTVLSLLGPEGTLMIVEPKLGLVRAQNCFGASTFC